MRILIVEDEHRIAQTIKKGLEQEMYTADIAYTGTEGYNMASVEDYDLIVLDVMLPEMNGFEVCEKLRKEKKHTPILILTAKSQIQDKITGLNLGADDYLAKPFSFEELLARIRALTRRPKIILGTKLTVGDLCLDSQTYETTRQSKKIFLSNKEFMLLEYLMRNAGTILTKDQIISHVWNYDADILPNTVEVYIRNLRKKIDLPFKNKKPLINTVRGFGYKIDS